MFQPTVLAGSRGAGTEETGRVLHRAILAMYSQPKVELVRCWNVPKLVLRHPPISLNLMKRLSRLLFAIVSLGITQECDEDERTTRRVFAVAILVIGAVSPMWGVLYIAFGEFWPGMIPSAYSALTVLSFVGLWRFGGWRWFWTSQLVLVFALPFALMLSLGGFVLGSAVILWAMIAPLGALWSGRSREAAAMVAAFLLSVLISGLAGPYLRDSNDLPVWLRTTLFVMNIAFVSGIVFIVVDFFVAQNHTLMAVVRRNRELESTYLQQEVSLRQSDKLATLGKLSAGLAHELNNPTAAAQQAIQQLSSLLLSDTQLETELAGLNLLDSQRAAMRVITEELGSRVQKPEFLDPLQRSDLENEIQDYLESSGVDEPWEIAPAIVSMGLDLNAIATLSATLRPERFAPAITTLTRHYKRQTLLSSLDESTGRIIEMVSALKSYTHLDQAPRQLIDIHEGLDSTLVMLQNELRTGVEVSRDYAENLPQIEAYGGELNQVWTNILDNAIDAMNGQGTITIATRRTGGNIVVELTDTGPGVPEEIVEQIFDPFVTTKPPGEGTGLGLNISHNIITQKHGGELTVSSKPGTTTFTVRLPIAGSGNSGDPVTKQQIPISQTTGKE
jgi:signal transduction histidine kinase